MFRICCLLACWPVFAQAGGFELPAAGQKALGLGGAFVAVCTDATAVYYNPGAMGFDLNQASFSAGGIHSLTRTSFLGLYGSQEDAPDVTMTTFQFFGRYKMGEKTVVGVGAYAPFGYHTKWDDGWEGRYVSRESELKMLSVQPTVCYQLTDRLGIGAGLVYSTGTWSQRQAVPAGNDDGALTLDGSGKAFGFRGGLFFEWTPELTVGLSYRSAQRFKIDDGDYRYASLPSAVAAEYTAAGTYSVSLSLPAALTAGIAYKFTNELLVTAEIAWAHWSSLDSAEYRAADETGFGFVRDYRLENAVTGRVGAQYAFTQAFSLRGGFGYEVTPFNSGHLQPECPDANKILFTVGTGWSLNERFDLDVTIGMENYFERQGTDEASLLTGTYRTIRYVGGLSMHYKF